MPPKAAPDESGRGRGRGRGGRGSINIDRGGVPGRGRGGSRGHGRGGRSGTLGPPPSGPSSRGAPSPAASGTTTARITAAHVHTTGVKRPGHGTAGRTVEVFTNCFAVEFKLGTIYHYNGTHLSLLVAGI
jgi:eukaryotic translation initiation factor 2C